MIKIFLSYAHEDYPHAKKLYDILNSIPAVDVWLDKESLLPGQRWELEIRKAIRASQFFLLLISRRSTEKKGFYQREIREALKVLEEYPDDKIFLIPVRLDNCEPHFEQLTTLQYVDLFPEWDVGLNKILKIIQTHRRPESTTNNPTAIRFRTHQAVFSHSPVVHYFLTITNLHSQPIELTHIWYEDPNHHIAVQYQSRPLPKRLDVNEVWETWLSVDDLPAEFRQNAYDSFRVRLSTGEVFASSKDDTVPPIGIIPGGPIFVSDISGSAKSKVSILFLASDPTDASRLRLGEELREIQEKL